MDRFVSRDRCQGSTAGHVNTGGCLNPASYSEATRPSAKLHLHSAVGLTEGSTCIAVCTFINVKSLRTPLRHMCGEQVQLHSFYMAVLGGEWAALRRGRSSSKGTPLPPYLLNRRLCILVEHYLSLYLPFKVVVTICTNRLGTF
jgi:hypothetical protein